MNNKSFHIFTLLFVTTLFCLFITGCSNKDYETCRTDLENMSKKLSNCEQQESYFKTENSDLEKKVFDLTKKIDTLSQTAEGLWNNIIQCTDDNCSESTLDRFIATYPIDPRSSEAKKKAIIHFTTPSIKVGYKLT